MSGKLTGAVWGLELSRSEREVLQAMTDHADDDGTNCYPSIAYLVWKTALSERQTQRALKSLREAGILEPVAYPRGGRGHATEYRIHLERAKLKAPFHPPKGDISDLKGDTIMAPFNKESPEERVPFSTIKGDISDLKGDIAMSPQPSIEPSVKEPSGMDDRDRESINSARATLIPFRQPITKEYSARKPASAVPSQNGALHLVTVPTGIPPGFEITAERARWAERQASEHNVSMDGRLVGKQFLNHFRNGKGRTTELEDWEARWQKWVFDEIGFLQAKNGARSEHSNTSTERGRVRRSEREAEATQEYARLQKALADDGSDTPGVQKGRPGSSDW